MNENVIRSTETRSRVPNLAAEKQSFPKVKSIRTVSERIYAQEQTQLKGSTTPEETVADPSTPKGPVKLTFRQVGQVTAQGAFFSLYLTVSAWFGFDASKSFAGESSSEGNQTSDDKAQGDLSIPPTVFSTNS